MTAGCVFSNNQDCKFVIISILLSHLCESIPVDRLASRFHRLSSHFRMNCKAFILKPPAFLSSSLFRLNHAETTGGEGILPLIPFRWQDASGTRGRDALATSSIYLIKATIRRLVTEIIKVIPVPITISQLQPRSIFSHFIKSNSTKQTPVLTSIAIILA